MYSTLEKTIILKSSTMFSTIAAETLSRVAQMAGNDSVDYGSEAVEQVQAKHAFSANIQVVKVADEMWQALLDIQTR